EREISNLLVANGTPGYEQGEPYRKMGWNASDTRPLTFTACRVPEENLLGPRGGGFKQFLHVLDIGRIGVAAMGVGLAQGALDEALACAPLRRRERRRVARREGEDQPAAARVHRRELEDVAEERADGLRVGAEDDRVDPRDHVPDATPADRRGRRAPGGARRRWPGCR